jgi:tetratricopeptide (TPR) repeat protein
LLLIPIICCFHGNHSPCANIHRKFFNAGYAIEHDKPGAQMNHPDYGSGMNAGHEALRRQNPAGARDAFENALQMKQGDRDARYWLANTCRMTGDPERAGMLLNEILSQNAGDDEAAFALAFLHREQADLAAAERVLMTLAKSASSRLAVLMKITGFLRDCDRFETAIRVCHQALLLAPEHAGLHFRMTRMLQATGRFEEALDFSRKTLELDPSLGGAWISLAQLQRFKSTLQVDFEALLGAHFPEDGDDTAMCTAFALGKAQDDLGNWPEAFRYYQRGNRLRQKSRPWDRMRWQQVVNDSIQNTRHPLGGNTETDRKPVFIIGMLRSGTTLLEQRLDRHPGITGRGELNLFAHISRQFPDVLRMPATEHRSLADEVWRQIRRAGPDEHLYVDKNPLNFRFLPLINALFPAARVIHMVRDGRDSCLSCFFQLFEHADADFTSQLEDLSAYYDDYRRLVNHWQSKGGNLLEVRYANLVAEPETELRRVTGYLGLPWDASLLQSGDQQRAVRTASVWQARQALYTHSIARWKNYADQQPDFFAELEQTDLRYGHDAKPAS